jgi:hypothetical protein
MKRRLAFKKLFRAAMAPFVRRNYEKYYPKRKKRYNIQEKNSHKLPEQKS